MSLVDLCDRRLGTEIRADVDDDIHLTSNLVSTHPEKRKLGYRPAPFTGSYLQVDVLFSFPVSLAAISFSTSCSKSCQAQIRISRQIPGKLPQTAGINENKHRDFQIAASTLISPEAPASALFTVKELDKINKGYPSFNYGSSVPVQLYAKHLLSSCQCLRITVYTFGGDRWLGNLCVIGELGTVPRSYLVREKVTIKEIICRIRSIREQQLRIADPTSTHDKQKTENVVESCSANKDNTYPKPGSSNITHREPPPEFLDSLTQQLMTFPMILPSGNVVDNSTLERHRTEEVKWGREPSDPFTGLVFTQQHCAVHHSSLKHRIDDWIRDKDKFEDKAGTSRSVRDSGRCVGVGPDLVPLSTTLLSQQSADYTKNKDRVISSRLKRFLPVKDQLLSSKRTKISNCEDLELRLSEKSNLSNVINNPDKNGDEVITNAIGQKTSDKFGCINFQKSNNVTSHEVVEILDDNNCSRTGFNLQQRLEQLSKHDERLEDF